MAQAQTRVAFETDRQAGARTAVLTFEHAALALILLFFAGLASLYAVKTPAWEAPDEPAHYNYVRQIAEAGTLPELVQGDYDQAYLEKIKAAKFPPGMAVDSIRYESYQPPLYYLSAAPVYLAARSLGLDSLPVLRLYSVLLALVMLLLAYRVLATVLAPRFLALAGVALMASIPMNVAMSAAVNADPLAQLIVVAILLVSFARIRGTLRDRTFILLGGTLFGLALLTSTKVYAAGVLLLIAEIVRSRAPLSRGLVKVALPLFGISLAVSSWWFIRNAVVYGGLDILGWARHDQVVTGQPTTAQWIALYGVKNVVSDFFIISFKSFWAQFGWMGVLVNDRIYVALFLFSAVAAFGAALWIVRVIRETRNSPVRVSWPWLPLGIWLGITLLAHIYYNLRFVQPQGRYLFPALVPIAALGVTGIYELVDKRYAPLMFVVMYVAMLALDVISLFWFILPQLTT